MRKPKRAVTATNGNGRKSKRKVVRKAAKRRKTGR
jgi:hypothetical protein